MDLSFLFASLSLGISRTDCDKYVYDVYSSSSSSSSPPSQSFVDAIVFHYYHRNRRCLMLRNYSHALIFKKQLHQNCVVLGSVGSIADTSFHIHFRPCVLVFIFILTLQNERNILGFCIPFSLECMCIDSIDKLYTMNA